MMVHEILCGMFGAMHLRWQGEQMECQMKDFEKNFRILKRIVEKLSCDGPFVCRIITSSKFYAGRVEKIQLIEDNHQLKLKFRIRGCHINGSLNGTEGVFRITVNLKNVLDIQVVVNKNGQTVFWSNLFPDFSDDNGDLK